jgi:[amino group carrier protein]-lysine/ornithine hydrolase
LSDDTRADALLAGLVERYSPSGQEEAAAEYLVAQMQDLGLRATVDAAGNAVGEIGDGDRTVVLLGHIDTVPGAIRVRREDTMLHGRGVVDAKGALAAFACAAARAGRLPGKRVVVVGAVEEEAATSKGARYVLAHLAPWAVVIGEPSGWDRITVGYRGRLLVDYALHREVGHTAGPVVSAPEEAVGFWQRVLEWAARLNTDRDRLFDQLTPSLRRIRSADDGLVEHVEMVLGLRLPPDSDANRLQEELLGMAGDAVLTFHGYEQAFRASRGTPLARAFARAIGAQGQRAAFTVKSGTSDMNVVGPAWQCPIVAYGPGDSTLDHTPNERLDLLEYHRVIEVLTAVLRDL